MLSAKLLAAATVVLIPAVIGQVAALTDSGLPLVTVVKLVGQSVWMYAVWLLVAAVIAALTSDLRGFTTALVLGLILSIVGSGITDTIKWPTSSSTQMLLSIGSGVLGVGVAIGLLTFLYRTRTSSPVAWVIAAASAAAMMLGMFEPWPTSSEPVSGPVAELPASVRFRIGTRQVVDGGPFILTVTVGGVESSRRAVSLASPRAVLRLKDGRTIDVSVQTPQMRLTRETAPLDSSIRVTGYPDAPSTYTKTIELTQPQEEAVRAGIASATITGYLTSFESRIDMTLPLRAGAMKQHDGNRMHVLIVNRAVKDSLAKVRLSTINASDNSPRLRAFFEPWWEMPSFVLIDKARAEAVIPAVGEIGSSSNFLVLPGASHIARTMWLQVRSPHAAPNEDRWLSDAQLGLISWTALPPRFIQVDATVGQ